MSVTDLAGETDTSAEPVLNSAGALSRQSAGLRDMIALFFRNIRAA